MCSFLWNGCLPSTLPCFVPEVVEEYSVMALHVGVMVGVHILGGGGVTPTVDKTAVQSLCRAIVM